VIAVNRTLFSRAAGRAKMTYLFRTPVSGEFVKESACAVTVFTTFRGTPAVGKFFARSELGKVGLAGERAAFEAFRDRPWFMPVLSWKAQGLLRPRVPHEARLDLATRTRTPEVRLEYAAWTLEVLMDIYEAGWVHGDLQPHNIWFLDGRPVVTDFESMRRRTPGIPFLDSGDISGNDPASHLRELYPAFSEDDEVSFVQLMDITLDEAVAALRTRLVATRTHEAERRLAILDGALVP
jgi:hypothetical protein